jgi:hypothetical protein
MIMARALCLREPVGTDPARTDPVTDTDQTHAERIPIDVVTTDTRHFLQDAYLLEMVRDLHPWVQRLVRYREWPMSSRQGREFAWLIGAHTWPAIYINGELALDHVPTSEELYYALTLAAPPGWRRECIKEGRIRAERAYRDEPAGADRPG